VDHIGHDTVRPHHTGGGLIAAGLDAEDNHEGLMPRFRGGRQCSGYAGV
jgi:hypothetical protein